MSSVMNLITSIPQVQDQILRKLHAELPLWLDANTTYQTVQEPQLPGGAFNAPRAHHLTPTAQSLMQPLPPGDYIVPIIAYCSQYSVHRPGAGTAYAMAPLQGRNAQAIGTLLWRGSVHGINPNLLQQVSWSIQSGVAYQQMPQEYRQVVDSLIPEYRKSLQNDSAESTKAIVDKLSAASKGRIPSTETFLSDLGPPGQLVLDALREKEIITQRGVSDEHRREVLFAGQASPLPAQPDTNGPWTILRPGVAYARFHVVGGNMASNNYMELRILTQDHARQTAAPPAQVDTSLTALMGAEDTLPGGSSRPTATLASYHATLLPIPALTPAPTPAPRSIFRRVSAGFKTTEKRIASALAAPTPTSGAPNAKTFLIAYSRGGEGAQALAVNPAVSPEPSPNVSPALRGEIAEAEEGSDFSEYFDEYELNGPGVSGIIPADSMHYHGRTLTASHPGSTNNIISLILEKLGKRCGAEWLPDWSSPKHEFRITYVALCSPGYTITTATLWPSLWSINNINKKLSYGDLPPINVSCFSSFCERTFTLSITASSILKLEHETEGRSPMGALIYSGRSGIDKLPIPFNDDGLAYPHVLQFPYVTGSNIPIRFPFQMKAYLPCRGFIQPDGPKKPGCTQRFPDRGREFRANTINHYAEQGVLTPPGLSIYTGNGYDTHHVLPLEWGGTNEGSNGVFVLPRPDHLNFNNWWGKFNHVNQEISE